MPFTIRGSWPMTNNRPTTSIRSLRKTAVRSTSSITPADLGQLRSHDFIGHAAVNHRLIQFRLNSLCDDVPVAVELMLAPCLSREIEVMFHINRAARLLVGLALPLVAPPPAPAQERVEKGPGVVTERVRGQWRAPAGDRPRPSEHATELSAAPAQGARSTRVQAAGVSDSPDLEQRAMIDGKLYPCGKEAAEFLRKLIGDRPVSFYAFGDRLERDAQDRLRGSCFVEDVSLDAELVRNGWALAHHSGVTPYEVFAREKNRGLWRGGVRVPHPPRPGPPPPRARPAAPTPRKR